MTGESIPGLNEAPAAATDPDSLSLPEKVRFLSTPGAYAERPGQVLALETHLSWVFLAGERVYKLKKPVRSPQVDLSTLAGREANCREEVRLNARLAPDTYCGVLALRRAPDGRLTLDETGEAVDWLVMMRRLPADLMLDRMLIRGRVGDEVVGRLAARLATFYAQAERARLAPGAYAGRFAREQDLNRATLTCRALPLDQGQATAVLDRLDAALRESRAVLEERARCGHVVDGHGDLRPEHVCLTDPIVIFDCLEFSRELRLVDPFDELAFLGLECSLLGAPWFGPALVDRVSARLEGRAVDGLIRLYTACRAVLRARLSLAHLLDPVPREPAKWGPQAARYLALAADALGG